MVYSMPANDMAEFLEALLEASRWVPESFMNLQPLPSDKTPLELSEGPVANIFEHPLFSFAGGASEWLEFSKSLKDAPIGGDTEDWIQWFQEQADLDEDEEPED